MLPSLCVVNKAIQSCVDSVLPKLFGKKNEKSRNMGVFEKGFLGVVFRYALVVAAIILIGRKILFI